MADSQKFNLINIVTPVISGYKIYGIGIFKTLPDPVHGIHCQKLVPGFNYDRFFSRAAKGSWRQCYNCYLMPDP